MVSPVYPVRPVGTFLTDPTTRGEFGEQGLALLRTRLYPKDCQTCDRPLDGRVPSLVVDDQGFCEIATLHHPDCRPPGWHPDPPAVFGAGTPTFRSHLSLMPFMTEKGRALTAVVVVNPTLERMTMARGSDGTWHVANVFPSLGPVSDLFDPQIMAAAQSAVRRFLVTPAQPGPAGDAMAGQILLDGEVWWTVPLTRRAMTVVRRFAGAALLVTHSVDVGSLGLRADPSPELESLLEDPDTFGGWLRHGYDGVPPMS